MWIDTERIRFQDYNPDEFDDSELMTADEQAEFERQIDERERDEQARREEMERDQAAMDWEATEDYPF